MTLDELKKKKLPDAPGVYFFCGPKKKILYIGKATSLKDRVRSYFNKDLIFSRGPSIVKMIETAISVSYIETDSVLEALILEANLIKKHQPPHNVDLKDDKSFNFIIITKEPARPDTSGHSGGAFPRVLIVRGKDIPSKYPPNTRLYVIGPFPQGGVLKEGMKIIRRIFPYRDSCSPNQGKPCFNRQIGLCPGVCDGGITEEEYKKHIKNLILFFEGKKKDVIRNWNKEMKLLAKERRFEQASILKRQIFALSHIHDISLIKDIPRVSGKSGFRMEAYDIAHLSGGDMVGVMIVVEEGEAKKSDYRKFKIRTVSNSNDPKALKELLERRFKHEEWPLPNLMVLDGNVIQRNVALSIIKDLKIDIPIVSVVKDNRHRPERIEGNGELIEKHQKEILLANSEAHRFAISYHKLRRSKSFLKT